MKRGPKPQRPDSFWFSLDWTYRDSFLARRHRIHHATLRANRMRLGIPKGTKGHHFDSKSARDAMRKAVVPLRMFAAMRDTEIARKVGLSRERVRQLRKKAGKTVWQQPAVPAE